MRSEYVVVLILLLSTVLLFGLVLFTDWERFTSVVVVSAVLGGSLALHAGLLKRKRSKAETFMKEVLASGGSGKAQVQELERKP